MFGRTFTIAIAGLLLAGCGSSEDEPAQRRQPIPDPPGAAEALSLGGRAGTESTGSYEGLVNCAVALELTSRTLRTMSTGNQSRELRAIAEAAESFRARALAQDGVTERRLAADVERRMSEKIGDSAGQAQLSIACLRNRDSEG